MSRTPPRFRALAVVCCTAALLLPGASQARKLFGAELDVDGQIDRVGTNKLRKFPDLFDGSTLSALFPGYDDLSSTVSAALDLRGLGASAGFSGTEVFFDVPGAGLSLSFDAGDRDASVGELQDWLSGDLANPTLAAAFTALLQGLVAHSPVDPVAGNPNSLESRMFEADWRQGTRGPLISSTSSETPNLLSVSPTVGFFDAGAWDVTALDLPLSYAVNWAPVSLLLDVPLTATVTEGSWTGMGSGGVGLQIRPFPFWALTPAARIGAVGSIDVGGLAAMYSGTVTSQLRFPLGPLALVIGNMGGVAKTVDGIEIGGLEFSYDLTNWNLRNGGAVEGSFGSAEVFGGLLGWRVFGSDVRFFGSELYMDSYFEVGASLGSLGAIGAGRYDRLAVSVAYLGGRSTDGVSLALGARF